MSRPPSTHPTDAELEILKILWEAGPSELGQIVASLRQARTVATTTVATTLKVMMQKGSVERSDGPRGYLWAARVGRDEATSGLLRRLLERAFDGSAGRLVARLVEDGALTRRDRDEIRRLLEANEDEEESNSPERGRS
jgi:BlaI family transcriptional regulator, penicillinase repressor